MLRKEKIAKKWKKMKDLSNDDLQELVEEISQVYFQQDFSHEAFFNKRLRTTGGRYHLESHDIDINPKVFEMYGMGELVNVIKHELCHYHLHLEGKGHHHRDADFKALLSSTGGSRFVKPLERQKPENYYQYQCQKCGTLILRKRRMDTKRFVCGKCRGKLILKNNKSE